MEISDFQPISLIGCTYKIIAKLLVSRLAKVIHKIGSPNQTAFIKGRQILDDVLVANEVIDYALNSGTNLLVFKVDFAKSFDSVRWEFLLDTMKRIGFSAKWISWISGCLQSALISVLVNGSPTSEFHMERGHRQGDPFFPLLFNVVSEALQVTIFEACDKGVFKGLGVNLSKSCIYGVGVQHNEVEMFARITSCKAGPAIYLFGSPGGGIRHYYEDLNVWFVYIECYIYR
ncbi:RNA-directed DNA polymerase, eukaryota, reverse transcriptase zinc-binding domain protein [Tanacetum coccineum]